MNYLSVENKNTYDTPPGVFMSVTLLLGLAILALVLARSYSSRGPAIGKNKRPQNSPYATTSIGFSDSSACDAVRKLAGRRFLSADAPSIPVRQCGMGACQCRYKHHADRRSGPTDRRAALGLTVAGGTLGDPSRHGRRKSDWRTMTAARDSYKIPWNARGMSGE